MSYQAWVEPYVISGEDGTALTNTTTATSIIPAARKFTLPSNFFDKVNATLWLRASGRISTAASTPGTLTFDVRFSSTVVFNGGASGTLATSATNLTWELELWLQCRALGGGTSTTVLGVGHLFSAGLSATTPIMLLPVSAPAVGTGIDAAAAQQVDLFATWSVANASNTLTCHQYELFNVN